MLGKIIFKGRRQNVDFFLPIIEDNNNRIIDLEDCKVHKLYLF